MSGQCRASEFSRPPRPRQAGHVERGHAAPSQCTSGNSGCLLHCRQGTQELRIRGRASPWSRPATSSSGKAGGAGSHARAAACSSASCRPCTLRRKHTWQPWDANEQGNLGCRPGHAQVSLEDVHPAIGLDKLVGIHSRLLSQALACMLGRLSVGGKNCQHKGPGLSVVNKIEMLAWAQEVLSLPSCFHLHCCSNETSV